MNRDWRTLTVRQWEPTRYWVQSQTRDIEHLVDTSPWQCSCEAGTDYAPADHRPICVHQKRLRIWLEEQRLEKPNPLRPKTAKEAVAALHDGKSVELPTGKAMEFLRWMERHKIMLRCSLTAKGQFTVIET